MKKLDSVLSKIKPEKRNKLVLMLEIINFIIPVVLLLLEYVFTYLLPFMVLVILLAYVIAANIVVFRIGKLNKVI